MLYVRRNEKFKSKTFEKYSVFLILICTNETFEDAKSLAANLVAVSAAQYIYRVIFARMFARVLLQALARKSASIAVARNVGQSPNSRL